MNEWKVWLHGLNFIVLLLDIFSTKINFFNAYKMRWMIYKKSKLLFKRVKRVKSVREKWKGVSAYVEK